MENAISVLESAGIPKNLADLGEHIKKSIAESPTAGSEGLPFLKLDQNTGEWLFGTDGEELGDNPLVVLEVGSIQHGYFCWFDGSAKEEMVPLAESKPAEPASLGVHTSGFSKGKPCEWLFGYKAAFRVVGGDNDGVAVAYGVNNKGSQGFMQKLVSRLLSQVNRADSGGYVFPLLQLTASKPTGDNNKRFPRFKVADWLDQDGRSRADAGSITVESVEVVDVTPEPTEPAKPKAPSRRTKTKK